MLAGVVNINSDLALYQFYPLQWYIIVIGWILECSIFKMVAIIVGLFVPLTTTILLACDNNDDSTFYLVLLYQIREHINNVML